jgi:hypothetical protein
MRVVMVPVARMVGWASVRECPLTASSTREATSVDRPDSDLVLVYRLAD